MARLFPGDITLFFHHGHYFKFARVSRTVFNYIHTLSGTTMWSQDFAKGKFIWLTTIWLK